MPGHQEVSLRPPYRAGVPPDGIVGISALTRDRAFLTACARGLARARPPRAGTGLAEKTFGQRAMA